MEAKAQIIGTIVMIGETQVIGVKGFKKRPFVIGTGGDWPQEIEIEMINDGCDKIGRFSEGQQVKVSVNIKGRRYEKNGNNRFFNSLQGWKIEAYNESQSE